jgi:hydroxyacyl-ACP dehydratase HTD2-like protein with hotdog domain
MIRKLSKRLEISASDSTACRLAGKSDVRFPVMVVTTAADWVGQRVVHAPYDVTRVDIAKFAHCIGGRSPSYFDPEEARRRGFADVVAPLGYYTVIRHTMANLVALDELTVDGMSADMTPPTTYRRRIAAESRVWFHDRIIAGDSIVLTKTLTSIADKEGRSGPFTSVTYRLDFHKDSGRLAVVEDFVRILR